MLPFVPARLSSIEQFALAYFYTLQRLSQVFKSAKSKNSQCLLCFVDVRLRGTKSTCVTKIFYALKFS
jgi:hypothetical protein